MNETFKTIRPYLLAAAVGFVVSLLLGITHFQGWGPFFYKPLISAVIWGALAFAARKLLALFVPELEAALFSKDGADEQKETGAPATGAEEAPAAPLRGTRLNLSTAAGEPAQESPQARGVEEPGLPGGRNSAAFARTLDLDRGSEPPPGAPPVPPSASLGGAISESWVKAAPSDSKLPPRKPDAAESFKQDDKVLAKAVRSVMNQ